MYNCYKLFAFNYFPLTDRSESDIMRRIWQAIDTVFDAPVIDRRSGEKSSNASSDSRNQNRILTNIKQIPRKLPGRKVDIIFKKGISEFRCLETGRFNVEHGTKILYDGSFKIPKVLKDIFVQLTSSSRTFVRDLSVCGFLLVETKMSLMTLDSPAEYVCRVNRLTPLLFPNVIETFSRKMLPIVEVIYKPRLLMEKPYVSLIDDQTPLIISFNHYEQGHIPLCFQAISSLATKRKRTTSSEIENEEL